MTPTHYSLLGHYTALLHNLEKASGGTTAAKKARAAAIAALKAKLAALHTAHNKLTAALDDYESSTSDAVSTVNRALSDMRSAPLPAASQRSVEAAMNAGAMHMDQIHRLLGDADDGSPDPIPTPTSSGRRSS